jgi:hypothetical protein
MPASEVMHKWKHGQLHSGSKKGPVVKNQKQAIAIMLSEKRKGYQMGGSPLTGLGGGVLPQQFGSPIGSAFGGRGDSPTLMGAGGQGQTNQQWLSKMPASPMAPVAGLQQQNGMMGGRPDGGSGTWGGGQGGDAAKAASPGASFWPGMRPMQFGGGLGGGLAPFVQRQEMRGLANDAHVGPIISSVGGRTDHHPISVPSGSYVLPAAHVSALGQGNTLNGMKVLQGMFGGAPKFPRPLQANPMHMGMGMPRMVASGGRADDKPPPAPSPKIFQDSRPGWPPLTPLDLGLYSPLTNRSDRGGAREGAGKQVPIMAAGGEYVLTPQQVLRVGRGYLDHGHQILDRWVQNVHKNYAKTIANLPPPAKS